MKTPPGPLTFYWPRQRRAAGFSLVEVTLAMGIVAFALVGVIGLLPVALNSNRQSYDENRAAAVAETLFASFRSQPFQAVCYLDAQFDSNGIPLANPTVLPLDLNASTQSSATGTPPTVQCYATFLDPVTNAATTDSFGDQRHLRFGSASSSAADYFVRMSFNNQPDGMTIGPQPSSVPNGQPTTPAQANRVELIISAVSRPQNQYRFVSTVANRSN